MLYSSQRTIRHPVSISGIAIHSGKMCNLTLKPAEANSGITFIRKDLKNNNVINASYDNVSQAMLCTTISNSSSVSISTIEHLMAALWANNIDNLIVEVDNSEIPILDGSAKEFHFMIESARVVENAGSVPRRYIEVLKPVKVEHNGAVAEIIPDKQFSVEVSIEYPNSPAIGNQNYKFIPQQNDDFHRHLARARTYALKEDVEYLHARGLGLGGSLDNAVVVDDDKVLNEGGFRFNDEPVRHKVLDCLGDLRLAGFFINARVIATRTGHLLNNMLLRELFSTNDSWQHVVLQQSLGYEQH